jgi:hypothetical protein
VGEPAADGYGSVLPGQPQHAVVGGRPLDHCHLLLRGLHPGRARLRVRHGHVVPAVPAGRHPRGDHRRGPVHPVLPPRARADHGVRVPGGPVRHEDAAARLDAVQPDGAAARGHAAVRRRAALLGGRADEPHPGADEHRGGGRHLRHHRDRLHRAGRHLGGHLDGRDPVHDHEPGRDRGHGGGGAGVGVLFGPLGVMANIKMIESNTMKDVAVLKDKVAIDPNQLFLDAAIKYGIAISNGASNTNYRLNPYLLVQKIESDVIMIASAILVDHAGSNSKVPSRYLIQLPATYSIDELSSLDAEGIQQLEKLVENGYLTLISRIIAESNANIELEEKVTLTSEFLTPRFNIQLAGNLIDKDETYTWLRLVGGVYGVKNSDVVLKMADARKR